MPLTMVMCPVFEQPEWTLICTRFVGESAHFNVLVTPKSGQSNQISVTFSNSSVLGHTTNVTEQSSSDSNDGVSILKRNGTVVLVPVSSKLTGRVEVQVEPQAGNLACATFRHV
jgi:hypothetical protein